METTFKSNVKTFEPTGISLFETDFLKGLNELSLIIYLNHLALY